MKVNPALSGTLVFSIVASDIPSVMAAKPCPAATNEEIYGEPEPKRDP